MLILRNELDADLFVNAKELKASSKTYDSIICGFGSTSCEKKESVEFLNRNKNAKLFWLVGEYEQSTFAPLFYSGRDFAVLKNYKHEMKNKRASSQHFLNLNTLLAKAAPEKVQEKKLSGIYYGRWREDRSIYFKKYLQGEVLLSTSAKNMKIFIGNNCHPRFCKPLNWTRGKETLRIASASLYIEDVFTHTHYNCPANRFYEAIFCGCPIAFQPESLNTFEEYGISVPNYMVVSNHAEFKEFAEKMAKDVYALKNTLCIQKEWGDRAVKEKLSVINEIKDIIRNGS